MTTIFPYPEEKYFVYSVFFPLENFHCTFHSLIVVIFHKENVVVTIMFDTPVLQFSLFSVNFI